MTYKKTNWTSTTPMNLINLNKMEDGIEQNNEDIKNKTKVLWKNSSPTTNFGSATINFSSSDYDYLLINFISNTTGGDGSSIIIKKGQNANLRYLTYTRTLTYVSDTSYIFGDGYLDNNVRNWLNVPIEIVGIKI